MTDYQDVRERLNDERPGNWWIWTDGPPKGEKVLGPFESRELALDVRAYVERERIDSLTFWVYRDNGGEE